jgi:hypothetical protein
MLLLTSFLVVLSLALMLLGVVTALSVSLLVGALSEVAAAAVALLALVLARAGIKPPKT